MNKRFITTGLCSTILILSLVTSPAKAIQAGSGVYQAANTAISSNVGWTQVNENGFGYVTNSRVTSLEVFGGDLYAGASNWGYGGQVWRTTDGSTWVQVSDPGFTSAYTATNTALIDMIGFNDQLYVGTGWGSGAGQIWRSPNGSDWTPIETAGFGDPGNQAIAAFGIFDNMLYVTTQSSNGLEIWRSSTGNSGDWSRVVDNGNGNANNSFCTGLIEFGGYFYAAIQDDTDGAEIWRTSNGTSWTAVASGGINAVDNTQTGGFAILGGYLYIGTRNDVTGGQIWRSSNGTTWNPVMSDGFGDINNFKIESLLAFAGKLYAGTDNVVTGVEVWESSDGSNWTQVNRDGFGDSNNINTLWSAGTVVFNDKLYVSTANEADGGEVWATMVVRGRWIPTGSLNTARDNHIAIPLPNGKVLVVGGGNYLTSAELYDPATGVWTVTGSLNIARVGFTATLLANGKVLVAGGSGNGADAGTSAELYDPDTGLWTTTGSLNSYHDYHAAVLLSNGKVLVAGGNTFIAELYDPGTGLWTPTGSTHAWREECAAVRLLNGKVLVAGGSSFGNYDSAELYDPDTGQWTFTSSRIDPHAYPTVTLLNNGKVLVAGGYNPYGASFNSAELYDPDTGQWTATGSMNTGRWHHTAVLLTSGLVLVAGGTDAMQSAELYDPVTGLWYGTDAMNIARMNFTTTLLPNGQVLAAGGWYDSPLRSAELYIPEIVISGNTGTGEVALQYTDGTPKTITSAGNGSYLIVVPSGWAGTVTPSKTGYSFTPESRTYTNVTADQTEQNYTAVPVAQPQYKLYLPNILR